MSLIANLQKIMKLNTDYLNFLIFNKLHSSEKCNLL